MPTVDQTCGHDHMLSKDTFSCFMSFIHMEVFPSCTNLFIKLRIFYCIYILAHISFHSKYGYQIHKYHEKQQLLENRVMPNEAQ